MDVPLLCNDELLSYKVGGNSVMTTELAALFDLLFAYTLFPIFKLEQNWTIH